MYITEHLAANFGAKVLMIQEKERFCMDSYQFILMQKGAVTISFSDTGEKISLQQDDVLLISPNRPFDCAPVLPNHLIGVRLERSMLAELLNYRQSLYCNSTKENKKEYAQLRKLLTDLCITYYQENNRYRLLSLLYELFDLLKKHFVISEAPDTPDTELLQERIASIEQYIQASYHQPLSLELLADKFYLTPQYLSKFIRKYLGSTFSHYLTKIRLEHAHQELVHTDHSVTLVALNNGFPNIAAFNKAFRETYHCSPSAYRSQYSQPATETKNIAIPIVAAVDSLHNTPIEISTSIGAVKPFHRPWDEVINIGSLPDALKIAFHDSFLEYQACIPVRYVRFCNFFSQEILAVDARTGEINFTTLDEILTFFHSANVIPFVELAFKPRMTHTQSFCPDYWQSVFPPEPDDDDCCRLLRTTLIHCVQQFGITYMSQWRFELWLKHGDRLSYPSSFDAYFEKYLGYYRIIKEILPGCTMGGPGFNMCGSMPDFQRFLNEAAQKRIPFDYLTLYGFSYETQTFDNPDIKDSQGILSMNKNHICDTYVKYNALVQSSPYRDVPVLLTELGSVVALENHVVDSAFQAAFLCHNMLQLLSCCPAAAYLSFWGSEANITLPSSICYPSFGLVSENGIPNPALHAYSFLARLGHNLVSARDGYVMTRSSSNQFQLLFYHYTHFSRSFCLHSWNNYPLEQTYELFEKERTQTVHFTCSQFPPGRYKAVKYSLNRNYGSALDKHLRTLESNGITPEEFITALKNLKEDESRYYKQTSIPRQDIYYIQCDDTLTFNFTLEPHEVIFYEFSRIS